MLDVTLAGGLRIAVDGRELAPPRARRAQALLAYLALHPGEHARGALAGRFWPDVLEESARTSLRAALSELRRALGPGADHLVATRDRVGLAGARVDVQEFAALRAAGREAEALAHCAADILPGLDDDWVVAARDAHRRERAEALEALAASASDPAEAVRLSRERLALDPLDEAAARALMRRQVDAGDRAGAHATYARLADRLRAELRIAPSAETRALAAELRGGTEPIPPPRAARARGPFVGRARELERLLGLWADVRETAERRLVWLGGEPGIGKTRLALELAARVAGGAHVLLGRCRPDPPAAYAPLADVLDHVAHSRSPEAVAALAGPAAPELGRLSALLGVAPEGSTDRRRLFEAVDAVLSGLAAERPLLLVLDDLQWADPPTLALVAHVVRSTRPAALLVTCTTRRASGVLPELRAEGLAEALDVRPLTAPEVRELVTASGGTGEEDVLQRSGGNAFLVGELVRAHRAGEPVPGGVRESVAARLAALGAGAAVVELAAVLGREVDRRALPDDLAALEAALEAHLLRETEAGTLEFAHDLVREGVLATLSAPRRAALHRQAAAALERLGRDEAAAAHLAHAAPEPGDAPLLERAGRRALARAAYEDAAGHLALALEAQPADPGPVLVALGEARLRAGAVDTARETFRAAAAQARVQGDRALLARAALGHGGIGVVVAAPDPVTIALLEEALPGAADAQRARLLARLAVERYYSEPRGTSERLSAQAVEAAELSGDPTALVYALNARRVALWRPDRLAEREATARRMLAAAIAAGDREAELQARNWLVVDAFERGDGAAWRRERGEHERLADELRLAAFEWYGPLWRAVDASLSGDLPAAQRLSEEARMLGRRAGDRNADLFPDMIAWAQDLLRREADERTLDSIERAMEGSPATASYRSGLAYYLVRAGRPDEAAAIVEDLVRDDFAALPFDVNWASAVGELAEACVLLPGAPRAREIYAAIEPYAAQPLTAGRAVTSYGSASRPLGLLAEALGEREAAVAHLEAAIAADDAFGAHLWAAQARTALARLTGNADLAREAEAVARRANAPGVAVGR